MPKTRSASTQRAETAVVTKKKPESKADPKSKKIKVADKADEVPEVNGNKKETKRNNKKHHVVADGATDARTDDKVTKRRPDKREIVSASEAKNDAEEEVPSKKAKGKSTKEKKDVKQKKVKAAQTSNENDDDKKKKVTKKPKAPVVADGNDNVEEEVVQPERKKRVAKKTKEIENTENGNDDDVEPPKQQSRDGKETAGNTKKGDKKAGGKPKAPTEDEDNEAEAVEVTSKVNRKRGKKEEEKVEAVVKPKKIKKVAAASSTSEVTDNIDTKKNKTLTDWGTITFSTERVNADGDSPNLKITSWNVDGLRAWVKKDGIGILKHDSPDIICLQETKCPDDDIPEEIEYIEGYEKYWRASNTKGYAGVGLLTKKKPIQVIYGIENEEHDGEGRCITAEFENFYLVSVYVPNAGRQLKTLDKRLDWNEAFKQFIKNLDEKKPVIICGDMNVAHNEIDLKNPKANKKNAGFTQEERDGMTDFLESGFVDTFRAIYPDKEDVYTFWSYITNARKKNVGWRLDYFLVSNRIQSKVCDNIVLDQVFGSDHCPVTLFINI